MRQRGFTLIEVLLVLALISVAGSLVILNAHSLLQGIGSRPLPDILQKALREARFQAAAEREITFLRFDHDSGDFIITAALSGERARIPSGQGPRADGLSVEWFHLLPGTGTGRAAFDHREPVESIAFHPDRSTTPFAVRLRFDGASLDQVFDPFSDLVLEERR